MRWTDLTLIAGLPNCLTGFVLMLRQAGQWARERAREKSTGHLDVFGDAVSLAALFGGIALMQLGNVAEHISDKTLPADLRLRARSAERRNAAMIDQPAAVAETPS